MPRRTRRIFTAEFKAQVVLEVISGQRLPAEVCREHRLSPSLLNGWRDMVLRGLPVLFEGEDRRSQEHTRITDAGTTRRTRSTSASAGSRPADRRRCKCTATVPAPRASTSAGSSSTFLYDRSAVGNMFRPEGEDVDYARFLQEKAHKAVRSAK